MALSHSKCLDCRVHLTKSRFQLLDLVGKADLPHCNDEISCAIWKFFECNLEELNHVSQSIYDAIMSVPPITLSLCIYIDLLQLVRVC